MAELAGREDVSGVVFDDPVSSFDHTRRALLARRLAELAQKRQVVVFTHDLVFLYQLKAAASEVGVSCVDREIRRAGDSAGYCREKAPTKAMTVSALIGELNARQQECDALHRAGDPEVFEAALRIGYGLLRETWERTVEEVLFNKAVMRFGHTVQSQRLNVVSDITPSDVAIIEAGMTLCSKWMRGHAEAAAINDPLPTPQDFKTAIKSLDDFVAGMRKRGRS